MLIHVHQGKGSRDRDLPLTPKLLEALRDYWRSSKRKLRVYQFPSRFPPIEPERPISDKVVWHACHEAALRAGLTTRIGPHTLRNASAYYTTFQSAFILKAIALARTQLTAVYGRNGRLALAPARLAN